MNKLVKGAVLATAAAALLAAGCASQSCSSGKCTKSNSYTKGSQSTCKGIASCKVKSGRK